MDKIGVVVESNENSIHSSTFEMLTAVQSSAREVYAIVLDGNAEAYRGQLQEYGAHKVVAVSTESSDACFRNPVFQAKALIAVLERFAIADLLGITRAFGKDVLPRVAAALDAPLVMDCLEINLESQSAKKALYGGSATATVQLKGKHRIYGLKPDRTAPAQSPVTCDLLPLKVSYEDDGRLLFETEIKNDKDGQAGLELAEARVVISGGRSMGSAENFKILHDCAKQMGATVGASRAAVEEGFASHEMQIGQTGKTVSPDLYLACGISGAVQHFAGMKTARVVVAINLDPNAPFFKKCDYGIVADLFEAVPIITEILKSR
ncbi:MAG: electron transfer flavoprotein subunit alpha/FixB family protein [SAR324 cluster bacterium]|nr:electron transfer flavoprotein subunit alpha/FixB family protein [SAR324 cluster bacterium]